MALLPAHPDGMTDHHIQDEIVVEDHIRVGVGEGDQRQQAFAAELPVFRGADAAQQMFHLPGEIGLTGGFLEHNPAVETVAPLEFVSDHQAAAVLKQRPDPWIEIAGDLLQSPHPDSVLQPVATIGTLLQRFRD